MPQNWVSVKVDLRRNRCKRVFAESPTEIKRNSHLTVGLCTFDVDLSRTYLYLVPTIITRGLIFTCLSNYELLMQILHRVEQMLLYFCKSSKLSFNLEIPQKWNDFWYFESSLVQSLRFSTTRDLSFLYIPFIPINAHTITRCFVDWRAFFTP